MAHQSVTSPFRARQVAREASRQKATQRFELRTVVSGTYVARDPASFDTRLVIEGLSLHKVEFWASYAVSLAGEWEFILACKDTVPAGLDPILSVDRLVREFAGPRTTWSEASAALGRPEIFVRETPPLPQAYRHRCW